MTIALYPGAFDPVTYGHMDIATRAAAIFEKVVMAVFHSPASKRLLFSTEERISLIREAVRDFRNIEVMSFTGLTVEVAREVGAQVVVRGLRMATDFEYEFEMALMNRKLAPEIDIVCLMTSLEYQYVSSSLLKEVAQLRGDISSFVPPHVAAALKEKLGVPA
ncbi:MAG: pantetheine-phosphate adenylyltransferase [Chloroflexi bacterium]|nr:pantetheine-phosphate adenylyltransferase [Chloroflexota bacterium]